MKIICVDLFCGAGGTSSGLLEAATELEIEVELIAINHWSVAIATHKTNHPSVRHLCTRVEDVRPREVVPGGRVHLLVAGPECTHHSVARGGKPVEDQKRIPAWSIVQWAQELYIDSIIIENVPEFRSWAPLGANGKPLKSKKGETYRAFLHALRSLGYQLEERVLCCADYGDATTRKRLFIVATRKGAPSWPLASHTPNCETGQSSLFGAEPLLPWRGAREIIDWTLKGKNIFERKKRLAFTTLKRIAAGMRTINGIEIEPFLATRYGPLDSSNPRKGKKPDPRLFETLELPAARNEFADLANTSASRISANGVTDFLESFVISIDHKGGNGQCTNSISEPLTTVTTKQRHALAQPFLIGAGGPARAGEPRSVERPLNTVLTRQSIAVIHPFLVAAGGPEGKGRTPKDVEKPLDTVLTENHQALIQPFLVTVNHGDDNTTASNRRCQTVDAPMPTVLCKNGFAVVDPFLLPHQHGNDSDENVRGVDQPMPTVTATSSDVFLVEPFIAKYYGTGVCQRVDEPLDTVTTHDRFGLVEGQLIPIGNNLLLGIRFRMLQPHELAAAQGFPANYKFSGKKSTQVKQIGNAVPCFTAKALCKERLKRYSPSTKYSNENPATRTAANNRSQETQPTACRRVRTKNVRRTRQLRTVSPTSPHKESKVGR